MARSIKEIQQQITGKLTEDREGLSTSGAAEWRLWSYIVAVAIHTFEIILDAFRKEIDEAADKITPGTVRWYVEQIKRFQNGHEILFNPETAQLYYAEDDPASRIVAVVAVTENNNWLSIKVAKLDSDDNITELSGEERYNLMDYVDSIKFAGIETRVVTRKADMIRYRLEVWYDPSVPRSNVRENVERALNEYRTQLDFNSLFYRQRFIEAATGAHGVITADLLSIERKGYQMNGFEPVDVVEELESGYFDYYKTEGDDPEDWGCELTLISARSGESDQENDDRESI